MGVYTGDSIMVNAASFGLPLDKILEFGNLVREALKGKDDKIVAVTSENTDLKAQVAALTSELTDTKTQLATALANDAADAQTITQAKQDALDAQAKQNQAESDASSARDELAALKEAVANNADNQKLLDTIAALEGEFGFAQPAA